MSLLDALNEVKKSDFDPKKGKEYNAFENIPAGTYKVSLDGVTHNVKGDRDFLMLSFLVIEGKYDGKTESVFPTLAQVTSTGKPMPQFVLARSISMLQVIGEMVDTPIPDSCFNHENETDAYEDLVQVLTPAKGKVLTMTIKESPNKKNPDHPYRNYEFGKAEQPKELKVDDNQDPFKDQNNGIELTDDDLPFGK
ncbi:MULTISPECIES: single-stranded DNA-binding protein [unclassified Lactobacillus]|uniref:single-stranded DNA-binding protein n=1 Tax=unclassified Lactobacillus TaxID=2620435 RepID=UPI000BEEEFDF|nr:MULTISPECIES: single-stranded DNA-binding protein [unclassified Lactobacillus]PEG86865.1 single-stranded DNA-binding protein [Lactobacillus sp. UMNPBX14]PEH02414.1 single-stranded DNA-binding protein [Lactobacillus sp. UMNPBX6]